MIIDKFYMGRMFDPSDPQPVTVSEAELEEMKAKKMTHHIRRVDKPDAEIKEAGGKKLVEMPIEDLRALAEELQLAHEGLKKPALIKAIEEARLAAAGA
jgi:hypothetical protein